MGQEATRYTGPATFKHSYKNEFIVACPKCQHEAVITAGRWQCEAELHCTHCSYAEKATELVRYKVSVEAHCDTCGKKIGKVIPHSKQQVDGFAISCSHCGATRIYRARNEAYSRIITPTASGLDPIFHLPLWLQETVRGKLFWAYNRLHLRDIKQYIEAKLRERQITWHSTMVETLPTFIKEAKNRDAILKAIEKMERK